ncbi:WecB/TagA/CpsF family glycosyltransferase [Streptacidiphilus neutrinimicus]|uniref:WecB/TagA/CpsF family glycosyltransferase n=1 Tax=Streptacidiphilus neutrinimicus TaxID=105420 RepID=UPI0005A62450|nr:WecB/TagA/CpsF family glycosyltransferase [Streptacidiphilus neutrinimicus]
MTSRQTPAVERRQVLGVDLDPLTLTQAVDACARAAGEGRRLEVGVVNAAKLVTMRKDRRLAEAVTGCDLVLADGQAVVWASRLLGVPLPERVAGIDLFQRLLAVAEERGLSVYFLGARREALDAMLARLAERHPRLRVAGARDGYFTDDEQPQVADAIAASGAQLLFLGMTSPKKELFTAAYGERTGVRVVHGVGGSFDVLAGVTRRAPEMWQRLGLEWLYRVAQEPRRLGRRYLVTNTQFALMTARAMLARTAQPSQPPTPAGGN